MELFSQRDCVPSGDVLVEMIRSFKITYPDGRTLDHSNGLIGYDFPKRTIEELLTFAKGLRIIPVLDQEGNLTVVITPYINSSRGVSVDDEVFINGKLVEDCCPQPPNTRSGSLLDEIVRDPKH